MAQTIHRQISLDSFFSFIVSVVSAVCHGCTVKLCICLVIISLHSSKLCVWSLETQVIIFLRAGGTDNLSMDAYIIV